MGGLFSAPDDRVLAVVSASANYLTAWKCEIVNNKIRHPAYKRLLSPDDPKLFVQRGRNGEVPTHVFKPDSFYSEYKV